MPFCQMASEPHFSGVTLTALRSSRTCTGLRLLIARRQYFWTGVSAWSLPSVLVVAMAAPSWPTRRRGRTSSTPCRQPVFQAGRGVLCRWSARSPGPAMPAGMEARRKLRCLHDGIAQACFPVPSGRHTHQLNCSAFSPRCMNRRGTFSCDSGTAYGWCGSATLYCRGRHPTLPVSVSYALKPVQGIGFHLLMQQGKFSERAEVHHPRQLSTRLQMVKFLRALFYLEKRAWISASCSGEHVSAYRRSSSEEDNS